MAIREIGATGGRPADDAWDRYARPSRWPEWSPQIRAVDYGFARLRPGTEGIVHGPAGLRVRFRVLAVDEGARTWLWRVSAAGVRMTLWHAVEVTSRGTRTRLRIEGPLPAVLAYLPAARWALGRLVSSS